MTPALQIRHLEAAIGGAQILKGLDLELPFGEMHAIMGPNGSGKSTLCHALAGRHGYHVTGSAELDGEEILGMDVDERARRGLMLGFQYPVEVPGVSLETLLVEAASERGLAPDRAAESIAANAVRFGTDRFLNRSVNDDLSGGEKKRSEVFQMSVLRPRVVVLDEIDSGLDIDAVRSVAEAVEEMRSPDVGVLMITHYSRILRYVVPDRIHVMLDGRIVTAGGPELADELEDAGYDGIRKRLGIETPATAAPERRPADFFTETPFD